MNVWLLHKNSEFAIHNAIVNRNDIIQDLNLDIIFKFMARNDKFIYKTVHAVMTNPLQEEEAILYRQTIITDITNKYDGFYQIYEHASKTIEELERYTEGSKRANSSNLSNAATVLYSLKLLGLLVDALEKLKGYLDVMEKDFQSRGMRNFYDRLVMDYSYPFVAEIKKTIANMNFLSEGGEITFSACLGQGLKADRIIVNHLKKDTQTQRKGIKLVNLFLEKYFKCNIIMLDDSKFTQDTKDLEAAGLAHVMKLYQGFIKELSTFFESLHYQMAFYIGAANLQRRMVQMRLPTTLPVLCKDSGQFKFEGLYDMSLAIYKREKPITNDLNTLHTRLFIITGANQGGKSTYLRSVGIAQLLMQCGMYVPADYYCNRIYDGIFSHFTRREDVAMNSGKLDEELSRMNRILSMITADSLLLMNESFATTTEREGSKIAMDVVDALYENHTSIIMVTHLYEFTKSMYGRKPEHTIFMSAERLEDGTRTYRMYEREPERTSYGLDLYDAIISSK